MQVYHIPAAAPLYTNTFLLLGGKGHAVAVDPNAAPEQYLSLLKEKGARLTHILLTHGHHDHVGAVEVLRRETGARVYLGAQDTGGSSLFPFTSPDAGYTDGETIAVDDMAFTVITTPGHSAGSVCLLCGELLFAGDTLFAGDIGRTDLAGGSWDEMQKSLLKLAQTVPDTAQVLPGHEEFSAMGDEKKNNRYLAAVL